MKLSLWLKSDGFKSVYEIVKCDPWNERYRAVISFGTHYAVKGGS